LVADSVGTAHAKIHHVADATLVAPRSAILAARIDDRRHHRGGPSALDAFKPISRKHNRVMIIAAAIPLVQLHRGRQHVRVGGHRFKRKRGSQENAEWPMRDDKPLHEAALVNIVADDRCQPQRMRCHVQRDIDAAGGHACVMLHKTMQKRRFGRPGTFFIDGERLPIRQNDAVHRD